MTEAEGECRVYGFDRRMNSGNLDIILRHGCSAVERTSVFHASVLLLIINFVITKVAMDPRGDSRVDPQTI